MNWVQIKTILWLRWCLICNQMRRGRGIGMVVSILVGVAVIPASLGAFAAGFFGGMLGLAGASPATIWLTWLVLTLAFFFFWLIGLVAELQRSETIDLQKLMHLPAVLGQLFIINFLVSHFTLSIIIAVPAMLGLAIGLAIARGPEMLLAIPLAAAMIFMISAWTYCFRGWLAQVMTNPRRRRTVIMCLTFALVLIGQGPNLYFNIVRRLNHSPHDMGNTQLQFLRHLVDVQPYVPPLWLPYGVRGLAEGTALPALLGMIGCCAIGAVGLCRAYRSTIRFYHGEIGGMAAVKVKIPHGKAIAMPKAPGQMDFLERSLPYVPEQAAGLALATFRSLLRAPEVKMTWGMAFLLPVFFGGAMLLRGPTHLPEAVKPFAAAGTVAFSLLMLLPFLSNQFGLDRDGFRSLMLSPADRRLILLGKNLACVPAAMGPGVFLLALISVPLRLPPLTVAATLLQLAALFLISGVIGNFVSIMVPQRIAPGTLRPTKGRIEVVLLMLLLQAGFVLAAAPIFVPPLCEWLWCRAGWPGFVPVNLILSAGVCAITVLIYWQTLGPLGQLLQKRETKILETVTTEVE